MKKVSYTRVDLETMPLWPLCSFHLLRARRNEKESKVIPATSFKYLIYLLAEN